MNCQVRRATIDDLPKVYTFERAYIQEIETDAEVRWMNAIHHHLKQWIVGLPRMFVAVQDNAVIGHCFWEVDGEEAVLASIYVVSSVRRCGCGSLLLQRFEEDARQHGFTNLTLGVHENNPAHLLYSRRGYLPTHTEGNYRYYKKTLE